MKTLYSLGEVIERSSTLCKYADVLEKEGYTFIKNESGRKFNVRKDKGKGVSLTKLFDRGITLMDECIKSCINEGKWR